MLSNETSTYTRTRDCTSPFLETSIFDRLNDCLDNTIVVNYNLSVKKVQTKMLSFQVRLRFMSSAEEFTFKSIPVALFISKYFYLSLTWDLFLAGWYWKCLHQQRSDSDLRISRSVFSSNHRHLLPFHGVFFQRFARFCCLRLSPYHTVNKLFIDLLLQAVISSWLLLYFSH